VNQIEQIRLSYGRAYRNIRWYLLYGMKHPHWSSPRSAEYMPYKPKLMDLMNKYNPAVPSAANSCLPSLNADLISIIVNYLIGEPITDELQWAPIPTHLPSSSDLGPSPPKDKSFQKRQPQKNKKIGKTATSMDEVSDEDDGHGVVDKKARTTAYHDIGDIDDGSD
jgi:hypothetical protein